MSAIPSVDQGLDEMHELIARLIAEHKQFSVDVKHLDGTVGPSGDLRALGGLFVRVQDGLTEHMVVEEFEFYPELVRRGLFDDAASAIMQQHHDLSASLNKMELALRIGNLVGFKSALDDLQTVRSVHQPAEEEKLFPLVAGSLSEEAQVMTKLEG